jgi:hypothetical protein
VRNFGQPSNKELSSNLMFKFLVVALEENNVPFLPVKEMMSRSESNFSLTDASGSRSPPGLPSGPQDPLSAFEMTRLALLKVGSHFEDKVSHPRT